MAKDVEMYEGAKEYVDTIILPLMPISFAANMKQTAIMAEFITLLTTQIERQFKGRILMLPAHTYLKTLPEEKLIASLSEWEEEFVKQGFKHIFYVTSDSDWKLREKLVEGTIVWIPSLPLDHIDEKGQHAIIEDQVKQLTHLFAQKWQNID